MLIFCPSTWMFDSTWGFHSPPGAGVRDEQRGEHGPAGFALAPVHGGRAVAVRARDAGVDPVFAAQGTSMKSIGETGTAGANNHYGNCNPAHETPAMQVSMLGHDSYHRMTQKDVSLLKAVGCRAAPASVRALLADCLRQIALALASREADAQRQDRTVLQQMRRGGCQGRR